MDVREAQVRDHDELLQIIVRSQLRCPALAQIPSRDDSQADYALAHLIRQQGPQDKVFVAQLHGVLLGCMAVTNVVDVSPLQQNFDLHVYDQLVQPEVYEAALSIRSQNVTAEAGEAETRGGEVAMLQPAPADQSLLQALKEAEAAPNAFAMTMLSCDPESQQQAASTALLAAAFDAFPDKDYCLLTLPPDSPEVPLLATFTRLLPPPGSALVEVLYLCHRFALLDELQVPAGTRAHLEAVEELLLGTADMAPSLAAFTTAMDANSAFVVCCQGQVVGMAAIQAVTDLSQLQQDFHTVGLPGLSQKSAAERGILQLTCLCMNPIFVHRARQVLLDILRRCKASMMLFFLQPEQQPPEALKVFRQVAPRHKLHTKPAQEAHFALFAFCHDLPSRNAVNSHIVVAGASDCGLSVLESLVLHERLNFTALTLLAPGGLSMVAPGSAESDAHYSPNLLARLGLHASVSILDAELVSIDREQQCVVLSDKHELLYGLLLLTVGLDRNADLPEQQHEHASTILSAQELLQNMPKGIADMDNIVVYGPAFEACTAIKQLAAAGVSASKVTCLRPAGQESGLSALLVEAAALVGANLPETIQVADIACHGGEDGGKVVVTALQSNSSPFQQEADLVVVASSEWKVCQCIERAAEQGDLVSDGRLVVDAAFRTNDPTVFAAGTGAKFSRRYGTGLLHSLYNSREVGQRAADSIAASFNSPFMGDSSLPKLTCGRLATTALPGGGSFAFACAAGMPPPDELDSQDGRVLVSHTQEGYCQLTLDTGNCIQSAVLCTPWPEPTLPPGMLLPLIGLSVTYLRELLRSCETDTTSNLPEYLKQPWAGLLYHESFPQLRSSLIQEVISSEGPLQELDTNSVHIVSEAAVAGVQTTVVDFVKQQSSAEFPQYDVSAFVS